MKSDKRDMQIIIIIIIVLHFWFAFSRENQTKEAPRNFIYATFRSPSVIVQRLTKFSERSKRFWEFYVQCADLMFGTTPGLSRIK